MSAKSRLVRLFVFLLVLYLLVGAVVTLRHALRSDPAEAAQAYVKALHERDLPGIYLYSDLLGPRLAGMMAKAGVGEDARKQMWAKDFVRFKTEFERASRAMDSLRRERQLLHPDATVTMVGGAGYQTETPHPAAADELETFGSMSGSVYHFFFKIEYPSRDEAAPVSVLSNIQTGPKRLIRSVVFRVEVEARPDIPGWQRFFMGMDWLEPAAALFPFRAWFAVRSPSEVWMTELAFDVDGRTLETF